jgi:predicted PolB exonuclease-like 3'-5' exonuclease
LTNRIAKASIGLAELDKIANDIKDVSHMSLEKQQNKEGYEKMKKYLDEIIAKYF